MKRRKGIGGKALSSDPRLFDEACGAERGYRSEWRRCRLCGERMFQQVGDGVRECPSWSVSCGIVQSANAGRRPPLKF